MHRNLSEEVGCDGEWSPPSKSFHVHASQTHQETRRLMLHVFLTDSCASRACFRHSSDHTGAPDAHRRRLVHAITDSQWIHPFLLKNRLVSIHGCKQQWRNQLLILWDRRFSNVTIDVPIVHHHSFFLDVGSQSSPSTSYQPVNSPSHARSVYVVRTSTTTNIIAGTNWPDRLSLSIPSSLWQ